MARLTKEEGLDWVMYNVEGLIFFKYYEKKYRGSVIGIEAKKTIEFIKQQLVNILRWYNKKFDTDLKLNDLTKELK